MNAMSTLAELLLEQFPADRSPSARYEIERAAALGIPGIITRWRYATDFIVWDGTLPIESIPLADDAEIAAFLMNAAGGSSRRRFIGYYYVGESHRATFWAHPGCLGAPKFIAIVEREDNPALTLISDGYSIVDAPGWTPRRVAEEVGLSGEPRAASADSMTVFWSNALQKFDDLKARLGLSRYRTIVLPDRIDMRFDDNEYMSWPVEWDRDFWDDLRAIVGQSDIVRAAHANRAAPERWGDMAVWHRPVTALAFARAVAGYDPAHQVRNTMSGDEFAHMFGRPNLRDMLNRLSYRAATPSAYLPGGAVAWKHGDLLTAWKPGQFHSHRLVV